jgi:magnesium-transporting ATPase (P-type)
MASGLNMEKLAFSWLILLFMMFTIIMMLTLFAISEKFIGKEPTGLAGLELELRRNAETVVLIIFIVLLGTVLFYLALRILPAASKFLYWIFIQKST